MYHAVPSISLSFNLFFLSILHEYYIEKKILREKKKNSNESFVITPFFSLSPTDQLRDSLFYALHDYFPDHDSSYSSCKIKSKNEKLTETT